MTHELTALFDYFEKEKGMNRDKVREAIQKALVSAAKKKLEKQGTVPCFFWQHSACKKPKQITTQQPLLLTIPPWPRYSN
jgi:hypothetical protein